MSREPGREGTEASEAWREAGRDMVVESGGAPRRRLQAHAARATSIIASDPEAKTKEERAQLSKFGQFAEFQTE